MNGKETRSGKERYITDGYIYNAENQPNDNPQDSPSSGWRVAVTKKAITEYQLQDLIVEEGFIEDNTIFIQCLTG